MRCNPQTARGRETTKGRSGRFVGLLNERIKKCAGADNEHIIILHVDGAVGHIQRLTNLRNIDQLPTKIESNDVKVCCTQKLIGSFSPRWR